MIRQNINQYILLGKVIRFLKSLEYYRVEKKVFLDNILHLYKYCNDSGLKVSKITFEDTFENIFNQISNLEDTDELSKDVIENIQNAMLDCEKVLDRETKIKNVYDLYNPALDIEKLIDNPLSTISKPEKLNSIAKEDFENGCKSLAYGLRTAFAFHFMRVIENLTYEYAKFFGVTVGSRETMGQILTKLSDPTNILKNKKKYNDKVTKELDHIRDQYRNPTQHPDATYSQQEAENLYHRCLSIINGILGKI